MGRPFFFQRTLFRIERSSAGRRGCNSGVRGPLFLQGAGFFLFPRSTARVGRHRSVFGLFVLHGPRFFHLRGRPLQGLLLQRRAILQALRTLLLALGPLALASLPLEFLIVTRLAAFQTLRLALSPLNQALLTLQLLLRGSFAPQLVRAILLLRNQKALLLGNRQLLLFDDGNSRAPRAGDIRTAAIHGKAAVAGAVQFVVFHFHGLALR